MTWKPDPRTEKSWGPPGYPLVTLISERDNDGETAHLISLWSGIQIRVLPDGHSSGQKRSRVIQNALETIGKGEPGITGNIVFIGTNGHVPLDPVAYITGRIAQETNCPVEILRPELELTLDEILCDWLSGCGVPAPEGPIEELHDILKDHGYEIREIE